MAGIALCLVHVFYDSGATLLQRSLGAVLGLIAIVAAWRYWHEELFDRLPLPEFAMLQMYVYFGMPTVTGALERGMGRQTGYGGITMALVACLVFTVCGLAGTAAGLRIGGPLRETLARFLPRGLGPGSRVLLPIWVLVVIIANTGALLFLPASLRNPATLMCESSGVMVFMALRSSDGMDERRAFRGLIAVSVGIAISGLLSGMLENVLRPLLITATIIFLTKRRLPVGWVVAGVLIFILLNPAKHIFRAQRNWDEFDKENVEATKDHLITGPAEAATVWWDAVNTSWFGEGDSSRHTEGALDRLNYLSGVGRTVDWAGRRVPFDNGSRWALIPEFFVPRFLHPNKPANMRVFNDRYNYLFGMQVRHVTRSTSVALPLVADGYWNFGWIGVAALGALAGLYWGALSRLWHRDHWALSWIAMVVFFACSVVLPFFGYIVAVLTMAFGTGLAAWVLYIASAIIPVSQKWVATAETR